MRNPLAAVRRFYQRHFWELGAACRDTLRSRLRPGMDTLETGSGASTYLFERAGCRHVALEHSTRFAAPCRSVTVVPLAGQPPWYDWRPDRPFDLILIDGPPARIGRGGVLRVLPACVKEGTVILLDDTHRRAERRLAEQIAHEYGFSMTTRYYRTLLVYRRAFTILERASL